MTRANYKQSEAQKAQWLRYYQLGTLVGLSRWLLSKVPIIEKLPIPADNMTELRSLMILLAHNLETAARNMGWRPKT